MDLETFLTFGGAEDVEGGKAGRVARRDGGGLQASGAGREKGGEGRHQAAVFDHHQVRLQHLQDCSEHTHHGAALSIASDVYEYFARAWSCTRVFAT